MKKKTKKILIVLCMVIGMTMIPAATVYAGGINGPESSVIGAASGTFMYKGSPYVSSSGALASLTSYLSGDGIDLTADQASRAISMMNSSIREGVEGGYLVYAGTGPAPDVDNPDFNNGGEGEVPDPDEDGTGANGKNIAKEPGKVTLNESSSVIKAMSASGSTVFTAETPVKNAGFSLNAALVFIVALGVILAGCTAVIVRYRLLKDEE